MTRRPRIIPGILVVLALAGCAEAPGPTMSAPLLPAAPADFGRPVTVRAPRAGEDARAYAAREKAGRLTANHRLTNDDAFYRDVETRFSRPVGR